MRTHFEQAILNPLANALKSEGTTRATSPELIPGSFWGMGARNENGYQACPVAGRFSSQLRIVPK